ncbi:SAM-dependent methyltransferase [Antrihabitans spumae]|uniref:SAM-dependent methyltransferase n=1 Tax=Antrihabitans spumae TaxID=3373370 RepID=A0ABW7KPJ4_9NOCA
MPPSAAERIVWTVDTLAIRPTDRILEIGCGHGVAVSLVAEKLTDGTIDAVDRSAKMIAATQNRNAAAVQAGIVRVHCSELADTNFGDTAFEVVFGIHVPVFVRGEPQREFAVLRKHLVPDGRLYLSYQPLEPATTPAVVDRLSTSIRDNGFVVEDVKIADLSSGRSLCVVAKQSKGTTT